MSLNERAASSTRAVSSGRSPSDSVRDRPFGSRCLASCGRPQGQDQGEQLLEPFQAETEQPGVDRGAVLAGLVGDLLAADPVGQLAPGQRPVVRAEQREVPPTRPSATKYQRATRSVCRCARSRPRR